MNLNQLTSEFDTGINWNAFFYIIYKSINTFVTFLLYQYLTPHDFAVWAITNSTIYMTLLWADFGLRKSIPRYSPIFAQDSLANHRFIKLIIGFYIIILCCLSMLFMFGITKTMQIYIQNHSKVTYCIPAIFVFEGINTLFRLIFHAYFFIKKFNMLATAYLMINSILDIFIVYRIKNSIDILEYIFINKVIVGCALAISSAYLFYKNKPQKSIYTERTIHFNKTLREFTRYSGMMWLKTIINSFSERNSLVPLIALLGGAQSASIFKISNDGALLFQRIVLKAIGTADTSFLAYIETYSEEKNLMQVAFTKLTQKVAALCLPLVGISLYIGISNIHIEMPNKEFQLFIILTFCYLGEIILLPYERVLEVKHAYNMLFIAYLPYVAFLSVILIYVSKTWIGLIMFICLVYSVRLVSVLIMVILVRRLYHVQYPVKYVLNLLGFVCSTSIGLYIITSIININPYISFVSFLKTFK